MNKKTKRGRLHENTLTLKSVCQQKLSSIFIYAESNSPETPLRAFLPTGALFIYFPFTNPYPKQE